MRGSTRLRAAGTAAAAVGLTGAVAASAFIALDPGQVRDQQLGQDRARAWFGVERGLEASSTTDVDAATALANPRSLVTMAPGLKVRVVSAGKAAPNLDQMVLWPTAAPTSIIACNEEGTAQPGLQRIDLATGAATTIVSGLTSCDPVRVTPWGTVLFGEEAGSTGAMYEILDPMTVTGATVDRTTGASSDPTIVRRDAMGFLSYEGLAMMPNGVTYYGNELSASAGKAGGAYYKFVPTTPWAGQGRVTSLDQSPLAAGTVYGLRVGTSGNFGQGFSYGTGSWKFLTSTPGQDLGALAVANALTGYYRPEDLDIDAKALAAGQVRFCGNNTGRDSAHYYGETICVTDGAVAGSTSGASVPRVDLLVQGSSQLNMPDNIAYQPGRGNWLVHEDGSTGDNVDGARNDDLWSCLDDGKDDDSTSDGCIRVGTLNDLDAEWTGGFFDPSGKTFYVSVQHNSSGFGTILAVTGWR